MGDLRATILKRTLSYAVGSALHTPYVPFPRHHLTATRGGEEALQHPRQVTRPHPVLSPPVRPLRTNATRTPSCYGMKSRTSVCVAAGRCVVHRPPNRGIALQSRASCLHSLFFLSLLCLFARLFLLFPLSFLLSRSRSQSILTLRRSHLDASRSSASLIHTADPSCSGSKIRLLVVCTRRGHIPTPRIAFMTSLADREPRR